jgi:hypothetical protein
MTEAVVGDKFPTPKSVSNTYYLPPATVSSRAFQRELAFHIGVDVETSLRWRGYD